MERGPNQSGTASRALKTFLIGGAACVASLLCLCAGLLTWVHFQTTYYVDVYKPTEQVEKADTAALEDRFTTYTFSECEVHLEWFTYDNVDITTGPYKLFVVLEPRTHQLESIELIDVQVTSSLGTQYEFNDSSEWPVELAVEANDDRSSLTLEPAFAFDFAGGEVITTDIKIRINTKNGSREERIHVEWKPVRVQLWTSMV